MTDYKLDCEQPTVKCRFVLTQHEECQMSIDLTLPELNQVQKGNYDLMELWDKKNPNEDKYDGIYISEERVGKLQVENKNPEVPTDWIALPMKGDML